MDCSRLFIAFLLGTTMGLCRASSDGVPSNWSADCVGRAQFKLPVDVEIAVTPRARILSMLGLTKYKNEPEYAFSDGSPAPYTSLGYSGGDALVSESARANELKEWLGFHASKRLAIVKKQTSGKSAADGTPYDAHAVDIGLSNASVYRVFGSRFDLSAVVGDRLVHTAYTTFQGGRYTDEQQLAAFVSSMKQRPQFVVPIDAGICMPFVFVRDDGVHPRGVAVTYRMKSHPDITIWIQDGNGGEAPNGSSPQKLTSVYDNEFFWFKNYRKHKYLKPIWRDLHPIKLAGISGHASLMELTRDDDTIDFGFFASARDDASKVSDPSSLQMFVIRDAKNAIAKGIEPMAKDEFVNLAQAIADSIKWRVAR